MNGRDRDAMIGLRDRCDELGIKYPQAYLTRWGYCRVNCTDCSLDTSIRGYTQHWRRAHLPNNYKSRKGIKLGPNKATVEKQEKEEQELLSAGTKYGHVEQLDPVEWRARAEASRRSILERYGKYQGRMIKERL